MQLFPPYRQSLVRASTFVFGVVLAIFLSTVLCGVDLPVTLLIGHGTARPSSQQSITTFLSVKRVQDLALSELLGWSSVGSNIALDLEQADLAILDLVTAAHVHNITVDEQLEDALAVFFHHSTSAARRLHELSASVDSLLDSFASFDEHVDRAISSADITTVETLMQLTARVYRPALQGFAARTAALILNTASTTNDLASLEEEFALVQALSLQQSATAIERSANLKWDIWATFVYSGQSFREQRRELKSRSLILVDVERTLKSRLAELASAGRDIV